MLDKELIKKPSKKPSQRPDDLQREEPSMEQ